jgi:hypothetical protein
MEVQTIQRILHATMLNAFHFISSNFRITLERGAQFEREFYVHAESSFYLPTLMVQPDLLILRNWKNK